MTELEQQARREAGKTPEGLRGMWNDLRQRLETIKP